SGLRLDKVVQPVLPQTVVLAAVVRREIGAVAQCGRKAWLGPAAEERRRQVVAGPPGVPRRLAARPGDADAATGEQQDAEIGAATGQPAMAEPRLLEPCGAGRADEKPGRVDRIAVGRPEFAVRR